MKDLSKVVVDLSEYCYALISFQTGVYQLSTVFRQFTGVSNRLFSIY